MEEAVLHLVAAHLTHVHLLVVQDDVQQEGDAQAPGPDDRDREEQQAAVAGQEQQLRVRVRLQHRYESVTSKKDASCFVILLLVGRCFILPQDAD